MKSKTTFRVLCLIMILYMYSILTIGVQHDNISLNGIKNPEEAYNTNSLNIEYDLNFSSYFGGNDVDVGQGIVVDDLGYFYVVGDTSSTIFPIKGQYSDPIYNGGNYDLFISKFAPNRTLVFSTYFGGGNTENPIDIFVDSNYNLYVVGETVSTDFPIVGLNANSTFGGGNDGFVSKFSSNGSLVFSTFLGGRYTEYAKTVYADQAGNFYVAGITSSPDFPIVGPNANSTYQGTDGFVTKFNPDGLIIYSTYIGGSDSDYVNSIAVDLSYNIYISGETRSPDFPTIGVNSNSTYGGNTDAYVSKFTSDGTLVFSTYLGGSDSDYSYNLGIDALGNIYVAGDTTSLNFPTTGASANSTYGGASSDCFVSKFSSGGELIYSTFLGGDNYEVNSDLYVDNDGNLYVVGETGSLDFPIEGTNANATYGGGTDGYITKINSSGSMVFSTYLGTEGGDAIYGITADKHANIYVTGLTTSQNYPIIGLNANSTYGGGLFDATIVIYSSGIDISVPPIVLPTVTVTTNITETHTVTETSINSETSRITDISVTTETIVTSETTTKTDTSITTVDKLTTMISIETKTSDSNISVPVIVLPSVFITMVILKKRFNT